MADSKVDTSVVSESILDLSDIHAGYGGVIVLNGVSLGVRPGEIRAVFGVNGAGKTTLLNVAAGLIKNELGNVLINGVDVTKYDTVERVRAGLCLIPENRKGVFRSLTVRENMIMQQPAWESNKQFRDVLSIFPTLSTKLDRNVGSLSGGEQQMVALLRAYVSGAKILLLDEISMGLAPKIVDQVFESVRQIASANVAVLIVEQFVGKVLAFCDYAYVLSKGKVVLEGDSKDLTRERIAGGYFGSDS